MTNVGYECFAEIASCLLLSFNGDLFYYCETQGGMTCIAIYYAELSWETMLDEVCERWAVDVSRVRVKFVMPKSYKTICHIESKADM